MDSPGDRFFIDPNNLPAAQPGSSVNNSSVGTARPAGVLPQVPAGFEVSVFAEGLGRARWIEVAPNGDVLLSHPQTGDVLVLRDANGDGIAETRTPLASGFVQPQGMAVGADGLYVADLNAVWKVPYAPGDTAARGSAVALTPAGVFGNTEGHTLRSLALAPDGRSFYVGIGSAANLAEEAPPRAAVLQFDSDGANPRVVASGMRNPAGLEIDPATGALYASVVERDGQGDDLVPDFLTRVQAGGFYGYPYAYIGPHPQAGFGQRPDLVAQTLVPDVLFEAHSTPIGFTFYDARQFPDEYRGDAFVALRGSWNSSEPHGFMLAHVDVQNGVPVNGYDAFMTGFLLSDQPPPTAYGRPTTVAVASDGTLLVGDDIGGTIYRVRYAPQGDDGVNTLVGGGLGDSLIGLDGNDTLQGRDGADLLSGNLGADLLYGNTGADTLFGGRGGDTVYGGAEPDRLFGDLGNDELWGDRGADTLTGGAGADVFRFVGGSGSDVITDFDAASGDRIGLVAGMTYTVAVGGAGEALLVFSATDHILLSGIRADQVMSGWFV